ncbi:LysE family translocator [Paenibacillus jiagnxiensis]|uniref:LysE family translocator n=1 Tax=Paenibacillus jiagnxiensis TaxID=3228926 RepID=UPI0033B39A9F
MNITSFLLYCIIVTLTPGPTNIVILSTARHYGTRKTMAYVWGATLAFGLLLAGSALLNHLMGEVVPGLMNAMRIIGSVYMLYLAYLIFRMGSLEDDSIPVLGFFPGFVMQFVNPKAILFTLTVLPGYVMPYYTTVSAMILFAGIVTIIGFMAFASWAVFGGMLRHVLNRHHKILNIILAAFLVYSAIMVSGII